LAAGDKVNILSFGEIDGANAKGSSGAWEMSELEGALHEDAILSRFDRSSPEALLKSIAAEFRKLHETNARLIARVEVMASLAAMADRIMAGEIEEFGADHPGSVRVSANQYLPDSSGFYPIEYDRAGRPLRWTGPNRHFSFQVFVQRRTRSRFLLVFDNFFAATDPAEFRCFVDGEPAPLKIQRIADHYEALGLLPVRSDKGATSLIFACPNVGSPAEQGHDDTRKLGLSFRLLAIDPLPGQEIDNRAAPQ
jgi:hypothetical protein